MNQAVVAECIETAYRSGINAGNADYVDRSTRGREGISQEHIQAMDELINITKDDFRASLRALARAAEESGRRVDQ